MPSSTTNYHIGLFAYVLMLIKGLHEQGVPVQKLINKSLVYHFDLNNPDRYIPMHVIYDFFEVVAQHFETNTISELYLQHFQLSNFGILGRYLCSLPNLLAVLQNLDKYDQVFCTNQKTQLLINKSTTVLTNQFIDPPRVGRTIIEDIWLWMVLKSLNSIEELDWSSIEILIPQKNHAHIAPFLQNKNFAIQLNQEHPGITIKTSLLTAKMLNKTPHNVHEVQLPKPVPTLSLKIEQFFENIHGNHLPSLELMSVFFGVSTSSLKRHLAEEKSNFYDITERWRFMKAVELLTYSSYKINEISDQLHYSNPANFTRAFRRWSGQSPKEFRINN